MYCYGARRDLHSFPTRRSSDLLCARSRRTSAKELSGIALVREDERGGVEDVQDRKSTRLNSSHPSISYAVFCLKKKTVTAPLQNPLPAGYQYAASGPTTSPVGC